MSVHLSRAKSITRFDDRYTAEKFSKSEVCDKFPEGSALVFFEIPELAFNTVEGSSHTKNQLDSFSRFDRTPTCDRQTQTVGHRAMASARASKASCGKNDNTVNTVLN